MIVGLDTSSKRLAWCGPLDPRWVGYFDADLGEADERRVLLFERARQLFRELPAGTVVACEEPLALKNGKTTRILNLAAGAIWAAHVDFDLTWVWVDTASWKKDVVGKGNVSKEQIGDWGWRELGRMNAHARGGMYELFGECPDLFDAWAVARWAALKIPASAGVHGAV